MRTIQAIFLLLAAFLATGCAKGVQANSFFDKCENLSRELKKIQEIPLEIEKEKAAIGEVIYNLEKHDYSKRANYIKTNYSKIIDLIDDIQPNAVESKVTLADDAEFVQIVSYLAISYPNASSINLFEKKAQEFIDSERIIVLDSQTKSYFKDIITFQFFIDPKLWIQSKQRIVADLIKDSNYKSILIQAVIKNYYLDRAEFQAARSYLDKYSDRIELKHRTYIDNLISKTQEQYEGYKNYQQ